MLTEKDYEKYPFLKGTFDYLRNYPELQGPFIPFLESPKGKRVIRYTTYRLQCALYEENNAKQETATISEKLISYQLAKMLISLSEYMNTLIEKFAEYESSRALESYLADYVDEERNKKIKEINNSLGFTIDIQELPVIEYVPLSVNLQNIDKKFKLVNMPVKNGIVTIERIDKRLIFKERIKQVIKSDLPTKFNPEFNSRLKEIVNEVFGEYYEAFRAEYGDITEGDFPPCISVIMRKARNGENLTHPARFSLVTFCHEIGMSDDEIVNMFKSSPKFDAHTTMYQIRHITGQEGTDVYKVPACSSMKTNGLCAAGNNKLCEKVKHPLGYYITKKKPDAHAYDKEENKEKKKKENPFKLKGKLV